ncbi:non-ribosomal peptide synthetase, partial [Acinetobacter sp. A47]|uniref:non-ribosomal peptide synthetase n=1 Tax=Acinetobacter sp. A47 TaxID=1561217 RepID=UPI00056F8183
GYPVERLAYIMEDASPRLLLADATGIDVLKSSSVPVVLLQDAFEQASAYSEENLLPAEIGLNSRHLAYVIYTSGSTGNPKGVMVEHQQVTNLSGVQCHHFGVTSHSRILQFASISFDASVFEISTALCNGAALVIISDIQRQDLDQLADFMNRHKVTHALLPPALFGQQYPDVFYTLNCLILGGESPSINLLQEAAKKVTVFNAYGPTEGTVCATALKYEDGSVNIGKPIANTKIYLLDPQGNPVPVGVTGELYIGGVQVARGYLNRPELTAERFLPDPFSTEAEARMYRTGDTARWLADGNIEYLGRNDDQVKIRGFRIELGEIEIQLSGHPAVKEAVVQVRGEDEGRHLVAWWIADSAEAEVDASGLHAWLARELPDYMVPRSYVRLDSFPLTPNGKLDKRGLPMPTEDSLIRGLYEAPKGEVEELLAKHWCELLGIEQVSRNDSFFMLGGNSLLAVRLVSRLRSAGYTLGLQDIFASPCLVDMA